MASVKGNVILYGINTLTAILCPVITFPYAARVLLPEGIGAVNFLNSIVGYIVLLTNLGIPMYAVREVAKYRDDKLSRDKITLELMLLSMVLCVIGYMTVWILAEFVPQIHRQASLFYILSLSILFNTIGVNWFYQGIEDFKFITIRAIIIRTITTAALFIFVRDSSDILIYGIILVGFTVGNNLINFLHLRKYLNYGLIRLRELNVIRHIKPALQVFVLNLITNLSLHLNSIMLGFLSGDEEVGYFTAGTKITHIGLTLISSLGIVLLPRCSNLIQNGDMAGFSSVIRKSLKVTLALSLPMIVGLSILAIPVTLIFCGSEYMASIPVLYLNAPVILLVSLTNIMGMQVLYPMDRVNIVIASVSIGAVVNMILNFLIVPDHGATGAAVATLIADVTVVVMQLIMGRKSYPFKFTDMFTPKYIFAAVMMGIAVFAWTFVPVSMVWRLTVGILIGTTVYFGILLIQKDALALEIISMATKKLRIKR